MMSYDITSRGWHVVSCLVPLQSTSRRSKKSKAELEEEEEEMKKVRFLKTCIDMLVSVCVCHVPSIVSRGSRLR